MSQIGLANAMKQKGSPLKTKINGEQSSRLGKGVVHRIQVKAIHSEWPVECYSYQIGNETMGWKEGCAYPIRQSIDSDRAEDQIETLDSIGIRAYFNVRASHENNEPKLGRNGYFLFYLIRITPGNVPSTSATRIDGLNLLRNLFMDNRYSKHPPNSMSTEDATDYETPMDRLFPDNDVINVINFIFDPDVLNPTFARSYSDHAQFIFGGPRYSETAVTRLGFGTPNPMNGPNGNYAPNFIPPGRSLANQQEPAAEDSNKSKTNSGGGKDVETETEDLSAEAIQDEKDVETEPVKDNEKTNQEEAMDATQDKNNYGNGRSIFDGETTDEDEKTAEKPSKRLRRNNRKNWFMH